MAKIGPTPTEDMVMTEATQPAGYFFDGKGGMSLCKLSDYSHLNMSFPQAENSENRGITVDDDSSIAKAASLTSWSRKMRVSETGMFNKTSTSKFMQPDMGVRDPENDRRKAVTPLSTRREINFLS